MTERDELWGGARSGFVSRRDLKCKGMMPQGHWLPGFNFNVEEWFEGEHPSGAASRLASRPSYVPRETPELAGWYQPCAPHPD
jgi:hypothetical protein